MREKSNRGSITVEAVLSISMFILFFMILMRLIDGIVIQDRVQEAVSEAAKEISISSYLADKAGDKNTCSLYQVRADCIASTDESYVIIPYEDSLCAYALTDSSQFQDYLQLLIWHKLEESPVTTSLFENAGITELDVSQSTVNPGGDGTVTIVAEYEIKIFGIGFLDDWALTRKIIVSATTRLWKE
jgi:hypothetical protein